MSKTNEIIEPNAFVEITEDVAVQNQSNLTIRASESATQPKADEGLMIAPLKVLKYMHETESLWLYNPNTVPITVGYNPSIT